MRIITDRVIKLSRINKPFNGEGLKLLPSTIRHLSIINCSEINDNSLLCLPSNLTQLQLDCISIRGTGLKYLPSTLNKLDINGLYITDEGMKILLNNGIARLPRLKRLDLILRK